MFHCPSCKFDCNKRGDWKRHVLTKKHDSMRQAQQNILDQNTQLCALVLEQQDQIKKHIPLDAESKADSFFKKKCANALEWNDFVGKIAVQSYTPGTDITDDVALILFLELDRFDPTLLPIHCTDLKRKKLVIKTEKGWVHDTTVVLQCVAYAVQHIQHQLLRLTHAWQTDHPNWSENEQETNFYVTLVQHTSASVDLHHFIGVLSKKVLLH